MSILIVILKSIMIIVQPILLMWHITDWFSKRTCITSAIVTCNPNLLWTNHEKLIDTSQYWQTQESLGWVAVSLKDQPINQVKALNLSKPFLESLRHIASQEEKQTKCGGGTQSEKVKAGKTPTPCHRHSRSNPSLKFYPLGSIWWQVFLGLSMLCTFWKSAFAD